MVIENQAKKALVSFTIEQTLLNLGKPTLDKVGDTLYAKYNCYFSDCLDHPEYLVDILKEIFGNGHHIIINRIKEKLTKFEDQEPISNFLAVISK
jgi:hypothetical protein